MTTSTLVEELITGYQQTAIYRTLDGTFLWIRRPGKDRTTALDGPVPSIRRALEALSPGTMRLCLPDIVDQALHYTTPGPASVARLLQASLEQAQHELLLAAMHDTGKLVRLLHVNAPAAVTTRARPTGPARLAAWMDSGTGPRAAHELHQAMRGQLGHERWTAVRAWCEALGEYSADHVLMHGALSTGSIVPGRTAGESVLLAGEDASLGPAGFDIGWLLGEFLELRLLAAAQGRATMPWLTELPAAFVSGYGAGTDPVTTGRAAVLRIMTHAHDFAAYVGWHPELTAIVNAVPGYIDTNGRAAIGCAI